METVRASVLERFQARDSRALSRLISLIENGAEGHEELLGNLYPAAGTALRIGVTGPPGSGKSTLVNALAQEFLQNDKKVGIIAVDPSSPFTGGALLGDRVRMNEFPLDGRLYFRSMATRGATGGLAAATNYVALLYDAFGFDITLIETVGVGQVELDIVDACDVVVVVLVPESGDAVQTMKAGLMEIGDIFCINKSDRPGAERIAAELKMTLDLRKRDDGWRPPIVPTEAVNKKNVDRLYLHIQEFVTYQKNSDKFSHHRRERLHRLVLALLKGKFEHEFIADSNLEAAIEGGLDKIQSGQTDPFRLAGDLYCTFKSRSKG